jgi:hypothetical protein
MMDQWKNIVATVAPAIASALGTPLAGVATQAITAALGITDTSEQSIAAALKNATPDDLLKLKHAENDFAVSIKKLDIDLEQIAASDRGNARNREIKTGDSWTPRILAAVVVIGYLAVQWYILSHIVPTEMREIVLRSMGTLDMALGLVLGYYFGSSAGSARKDGVIGKLTDG